MASKIYLCVDPGLSLGVATFSKATLRGRTYHIKSKTVDGKYDELIAIFNNYDENTIPYLLSTEFVGVNKRAAMSFAANKAVVGLAMAHVFGLIHVITDDDARKLVWPKEDWTKKGRKDQAHTFLKRDFDLSYVSTNTKKNIEPDTKDACVGVLGAVIGAKKRKKK